MVVRQPLHAAWVVGVATCLLGLGVPRPAWVPFRAGTPSSTLIAPADADDPVVVARGRIVYHRFCRGCHGRDLQGQALWRLTAVDGLRRAPALDYTGSIWSETDAQLLGRIGAGSIAPAPGAHMPAFAGHLPDADIAAVLAFIEATWPIGLRVLHAWRQPGHPVIPHGADAADWRLPQWCEPGHGPIAAKLRRGSANQTSSFLP